MCWLRSVGEFGAPQQISAGFACSLRYCTHVAQRRSTKLCTIFDRLLGWYTTCTFSTALAPNRILPGAKFTFRPSLAFSYIGSVTARHSSSRRQPNFAVWDKEGNYGTSAPRLRHIYSTGRPSRWASAHILVLIGLLIYWATVCKTVRPMLSDRCLSCPVCDVGVLW